MATKKAQPKKSPLLGEHDFEKKEALLQHLEDVGLTEDDVFFVEIFEGKKVIGYTYEYHSK